MMRQATRFGWICPPCGIHTPDRTWLYDNQNEAETALDRHILGCHDGWAPETVNAGPLTGRQIR